MAYDKTPKRQTWKIRYGDMGTGRISKETCAKK
jgi:hypothetical protein